MRRATWLVLLALAAGCGGDETPDDRAPAPGTASTPAPTVTRPDGPVWCPNETEPADDRFDARGLIGLSLTDAEGKAREAGCTIRVVERDGEVFGVTDDFVSSRINARVSRGVVIAVTGVN